MQRAPLRKRFEHRIPDLRLLQLAARDLEIEFRQVATVQVAHQVSCAEIERCPDLLHFPPGSIYPPGARSARFRLDDYVHFPKCRVWIVLEIREQSGL